MPFRFVETVELGIVADDLVRVSTPQRDSVFRALLSEGERRGAVFTPIHWTDRQSRTRARGKECVRAG